MKNFMGLLLNWLGNHVDSINMMTRWRWDTYRFTVNDLVVVEIKSVDALADVHHKQLLTYLKLSGKKLGLD